MSRPLVTCANPPCANLFAQRRRDGRYCSRTCIDLKRHSAVSCAAAGCTATFRRRGRQRFCSRTCYGRTRRQVDRYGITADDYAALHAAQGGRCLICGDVETVERKGRTRQLCVDHDHATGAVRGLLCSRCNAGLGLFLDDPERLIAAAGYLAAR